ncbi:hypothetical protein E8E13_007248 [Curvularia kusanoi]|uniref:Uncharacterized protein n=1 Tax=Curvularia kusanoi TaxID=90978 RepID=A0A9P4TC92_CURKU|nr:hypothetical protein E8E13_007248 [Curvularia kusanoi]
MQSDSLELYLPGFLDQSVESTESGLLLEQLVLESAVPDDDRSRDGEEELKLAGSMGCSHAVSSDSSFKVVNETRLRASTVFKIPMAVIHVLVVEIWATVEQGCQHLAIDARGMEGVVEKAIIVMDIVDPIDKGHVLVLHGDSDVQEGVFPSVDTHAVSRPTSG